MSQCENRIQNKKKPLMTVTWMIEWEYLYTRPYILKITSAVSDNKLWKFHFIVKDPRCKQWIIHIWLPSRLLEYHWLRFSRRLAKTILLLHDWHTTSICQFDILDDIGTRQYLEPSIMEFALEGNNKVFPETTVHRGLFRGCRGSEIDSMSVFRLPLGHQIKIHMKITRTP